MGNPFQQNVTSGRIKGGKGVYEFGLQGNIAQKLTLLFFG